MAVAVARLPHASQIYGGLTQTSQDALLDALLVSCEKPASNPPLESFGRDLKPYFTNTKDISYSSIKPAKESVRRHSRMKPSTPPVAAAAAAAAASTKCPVKHTTTSVSELKLKKVSQSKKAAPVKKERTSQLLPATIPPLKEAALLSVQGEEMEVYLPWAGPGFYVSPSPDRLPNPTNLLLG